MARSSQNTRASNWVLLTCILASSLSFIDGSVVNVGLPAIATSFDARAADPQWVINGYLLPLSALLLLGASSSAFLLISPKRKARA